MHIVYGRVATLSMAAAAIETVGTRRARGELAQLEGLGPEIGVQNGSRPNLLVAISSLDRTIRTSSLPVGGPTIVSLRAPASGVAERRLMMMATCEDSSRKEHHKTASAGISLVASGAATSRIAHHDSQSRAFRYIATSRVA